MSETYAPFWDRNESGYEGEVYAPNPVNTVEIGGIQLPGRCTLRAIPEHVYDNQKIAGYDGSDLVLRGYLPGPIDLEMLIWTPSQWREAQIAIRTLYRKPLKDSAAVDVVDEEELIARAENKTRRSQGLSEARRKLAEARALDIKHPWLGLLDLKRVVIKGISLPEPGPEPQTWIINWKLQEFVPVNLQLPAQAKSTKGSSAGAGNIRSRTTNVGETSTPLYPLSPGQAGEGVPEMLKRPESGSS